MPITLGKNGGTVAALHQLEHNGNALAKAFERLSSGLRINRASDDAAGLSLAMGLARDSQVFAQGTRNLNDGISALNIAEASITELTNITVRQLELAMQASNGVYSNTQRAALDTEAQALQDEYERIVSSTTYNGINLLDGSFGTKTLQAAYSPIDISLPNGTLSETISVAETTGTGTFQGALTFGSADINAASAADLNNDGFIDIVGTQYSTGDLEVRLGNGNGTFKATTTYFVAANGEGTRLVDLDGDGDNDILAVSATADKASVLLNNGNGTFKAAVSYALGATLISLEIGDVNGDGLVDMVYNDYSSSNIFTAMGNGNGTFKAGSATMAGVTTDRRIDLADINGDSFLDVVDITETGATVFLGNGNGTFNAGVSYVAQGTPVGLELVDVDNDGVYDLVTSNYSTNSINVLLGNGNGTFKSATSYAASGPAHGMGDINIVSGDFNADGNPDLVVVQRSENIINIYLGNGNGSFKAYTSYATSAIPEGIALADFNEDGVTDILTGDLLVFLADTQTSTSETDGIDLTTMALAAGSRDILEARLDTLTLHQGTVQAQLSRIESATSYLSVMREMYQAAYQKIMAADVAASVAELVRRQVLQQSIIAVLAQANLQSETVRKLLE